MLEFIEKIAFAQHGAAWPPRPTFYCYSSYMLDIKRETQHTAFRMLYLMPGQFSAGMSASRCARGLSRLLRSVLIISNLLTMKKTLFTLFALSGVAYGATEAGGLASSITLHGVTFTAPSGKALHAVFPDSNAAAAADMYLTGGIYYTNANKGTAYNGIYLANDAGLKFNHTNSVNVNHLYIAPNITIKTDTDDLVGQLNWSDKSDTRKLVIGSAADAWVDINANYGTAINVSNMNGGALYLNTAGALTLATGTTLNDGVTVYATITDTANERTLLTADFSNWGGNVVLQNADGTAYDAGDYTWKATAEGLAITKSVPEPSTATLSLLALAGLAVRRRRKQ